MHLPEEFKRMLIMEENAPNGDSSEEVPETFMCFICCDLLYKPVVLGCGHVSCFWCAYKSMCTSDKSSCPVCRNKYRHFPYVCQTLHFLLMKLYPSASKEMEKQTVAKETETGYFSPQLIAPAFCELEQAERNVSVADVSCGSCKLLLFRPVVLNCGHVFCSCCIVSNTDKMLKCEVCQRPHWDDFPKLCMVLDHYLQEQFPTDCNQRRCTLQKHDQMTSSTEKPNPKTCITELGLSGDDEDHWAVLHTHTHTAVGCDSCGMYPIVGERYRCKDCAEKVGYDLCKDCYSTSDPIVPGRFNQQHTSEHEFEVMTSDNGAELFMDLLQDLNFVSTLVVEFINSLNSIPDD